MSYTHIHLPELGVLEKIISEDSNQIKYYAKYGAYMGPSESVNYINQKINEYYENKNSWKRIWPKVQKSTHEITSWRNWMEVYGWTK